MPQDQEEENSYEDYLQSASNYMGRNISYAYISFDVLVIAMSEMVICLTLYFLGTQMNYETLL